MRVLNSIIGYQLDGFRNVVDIDFDTKLNTRMGAAVLYSKLRTS